MTDPIKAALEAGAAALCVVQGVGQTPNEMARARVEAAAVVAAVLRALPLRLAAASGIATLVVAAVLRALPLRLAAASGIATLPFAQPLDGTAETARTAQKNSSCAGGVSGGFWRFPQNT